MDDLFHKDVSNDFVEYFLSDLLSNMNRLNDMLVALGKETSEKSSKKLLRNLEFLREVINEEIEMLDGLTKFRVLTDAEIEIVKEIKILRHSELVMQYDKITRR